MNEKQPKEVVNEKQQEKLKRKKKKMNKKKEEEEEGELRSLASRTKKCACVPL